MIELKQFEVTLSDDDDDEQEVTSSATNGVPKDYKMYRCCRTYANLECNVKQLDALYAFQHPLLTGWSLHSKFCWTPCGINSDKSHQYPILTGTGSKIRMITALIK